MKVTLLKVSRVFNILGLPLVIVGVILYKTSGPMLLCIACLFWVLNLVLKLVHGHKKKDKLALMIGYPITGCILLFTIAYSLEWLTGNECALLKGISVFIAVLNFIFLLIMSVAVFLKKAKERCSESEVGGSEN